MAPHSPSASALVTQESASVADASPIRAMRLSLEPRNATSLSASPSLESLTPTHSSQNLCADNVDLAIAAERHASPFFAGWEGHPGLRAQHLAPSVPATDAYRSSATQYHTSSEMQSLHARLGHCEHHQLRESASGCTTCCATGGTCTLGTTSADAIPYALRAVWQHRQPQR